MRIGVRPVTSCCLSLKLPDCDVDGYSKWTAGLFQTVGSELGEGNALARAELAVNSARVRMKMRKWDANYIPFDAHFEHKQPPGPTFLVRVEKVEVPNPRRHCGYHLNPVLT